MEILSEQVNQIATLSGILGGLTLAIIVEMFLADDKRKLATAMTLVFCVATFMFLFSMVTGVFIITFVADTQEVHVGLTILGLLTLFLTLGGVELLLVGLGLAGWLHSKFIGIVTTVLAIITILGTIGSFVYILNQVW